MPVRDSVGVDEPSEEADEAEVVEQVEGEVADLEDGAGGGEGAPSEEGGEEEPPRPARKKAPARGTLPAKRRPDGEEGEEPVRGPGREADEEEPRRRTWLYVLIVAIIIIVPVIGLAYFYYGPPGEIKDVTLIAARTDTGMSINVLVSTGKPSRLIGQADLMVAHGSTTVYSGKVGIDDSKGSKMLKYPDFAVGNGDYKVTVSYEGFTKTSIVRLDNLVEKIEAWAYNLTNTLNATDVPVGQAKLGVTVIFTSLDNLTQMATSSDRLEVEVWHEGSTTKYTPTIPSTRGQSQFKVAYGIPGGGNYTVKVTFVNSRMKPAAPNSTVTVMARDSYTKLPYIFVNIPPTAEAGPNQNVTYKLLEGGVTVNFDGSASRDYDGTLVKYLWDFGDKYSTEKSEEGVKVSHKYTVIAAYLVRLVVMDSGGEMAEDTLAVSVE